MSLDRRLSSSRPVTARQFAVLRAIAEAARAGLPPTRRELCLALGTRSTNGIHDHLQALASRGLVEWDVWKSRSIRVTAAGRALLGAGSFAAESAIEALDMSA